MELVAITPKVWMLRFPVVNAYIVRIGAEYALVDTGPLGSDDAILSALERLTPHAKLAQIVLTHSHRDHMGSAAALASLTGAEIVAGQDDAGVVAGLQLEPEAVITDEERPFYDAIAPTVPEAPPVEVDRRVAGGDDLGWDVPTVIVEAPGHTPGSIAIHLPSDRLVFTGDNIASLGDQPILGPFNVERDRAIDSFHKLAQLDVDIACFGHGDPLVAEAGDLLRRAATRV